MTKFETICEKGIIGDVKKFDFDYELEQYIGGDVACYDNTIIHNGIEYVSHWLFFNVNHDSCIYGVLYRPTNNDGDIIFGLVGCKLDTVNNGIVGSFDEVYEALTSDLYFVD